MIPELLLSCLPLMVASDAQTTQTSVAVERTGHPVPYHLIAGQRPSPASHPDSSHESPSSSKRRKRGLLSSAAIPSLPNPASLSPAASHVGQAPLPLLPLDHIYRPLGKSGRWRGDQKGDGLCTLLLQETARQLSLSLGPKHCLYVSLPLQLSPLPSGSDYTCYFCSSSGQCWIKRHRHRDKEEED